jgi:hypothetical protein
VWDYFGVVLWPDQGSGGDLDAGKRMADMLRGLGDRLESGAVAPNSTEMRRDFVTSRLPPYTQNEEDIAPCKALCGF